MRKITKTKIKPLSETIIKKIKKNTIIYKIIITKNL
jgi:hypothetical protein